MTNILLNLLPVSDICLYMTFPRNSARMFIGFLVKGAASEKEILLR